MNVGRMLLMNLTGKQRSEDFTSPFLGTFPNRVMLTPNPHRPNYVKKVQARGDLATKAEWNKVNRFFNLHKAISK